MVARSRLLDVWIMQSDWVATTDVAFLIGGGSVDFSSPDFSSSDFSQSGVQFLTDNSGNLLVAG